MSRRANAFALACCVAGFTLTLTGVVLEGAPAWLTLPPALLGAACAASLVGGDRR